LLNSVLLTRGKRGEGERPMPGWDVVDWGRGKGDAQTWLSLSNNHGDREQNGNCKKPGWWGRDHEVVWLPATRRNSTRNWGYQGGLEKNKKKNRKTH